MGWLIALKGFAKGAFSSISTYIYLILFTVIGTLWFLNGQHVRTIKNQVEEIVEMEIDNARIKRSLDVQNSEVRKLKAEGEKLRDRVAANIILIAALDEHGEQVILEIDAQDIPEDYRGAFAWMLQKSMEELAE